MIAPNSQDQFLENDPTNQVFESFHPDQDLDSTPADQFLVPNILNFFHNPKIPAIGNRPNRPNRFKRPPRPKGPPPSQTSGTTFSPVPSKTSSSRVTAQSPVEIPDLHKQGYPEPNLELALRIFNDGLDNKFPRPRPVNNFSGIKPDRVLHQGLTIEEKTKFLADRDPNQNFILSAPSVNAGD